MQKNLLLLSNSIMLQLLTIRDRLQIWKEIFRFFKSEALLYGHTLTIHVSVCLCIRDHLKSIMYFALFGFIASPASTVTVELWLCVNEQKKKQNSTLYISVVFSWLTTSQQLR